MSKSIRILLALIISLIISLLAVNVYASEVTLPGVQWHCQWDEPNNMGDMNNTHNCGPTSLEIVAGYLRSFTVDTAKIKNLDDWLYDNGLIPNINGYNLTTEGTGHGDLRAASAYYFGLWNTQYHNTSVLSKDAQLDLIYNSLDNGHPVIIGVKTKMSTTGAPHWMVAIGLKDSDDDGDYDEIWVNDPGRSD